MRVFTPAVDGVSEQVAVAVPPDPASVQGALVTVPSDTVTVPPGVRDPLAAATLTPTETAAPTSDGSGVSEVIVVVEFALLTVWAAVPELPLNAESPP